MKKILSFILIAVMVFCCAFSASGSGEAREQTDGGSLPQAGSHTFRAEEDLDVETDAPAEEECACICHLFYQYRDSLPQMLTSKTTDCKLLFRVLSYYVRLFTWRMLGIRQYCACGNRHY